MASQFDDIRVTGAMTIKENGISAQTRTTIMKQDPLAIFPVNMMDLRVWDAIHTNLPGTAASDDLALIGTTFGSTSPQISAGDLKAAGATSRYARFMVELPECYEAGETVTLSLSAGMVTTVASVSCTVDVECYKIDKITGIGSDLCTTSATTINSLVFGREVVCDHSKRAGGRRCARHPTDDRVQRRGDSDRREADNCWYRFALRHPWLRDDMDDIGVFSPEQARALWQDYQTRKQLTPQVSQNYPVRRIIDEPSPHRVFVKNTSSETCPAYGCLQITGVTVAGGITVVTIDKPSTTSSEYLFNSQFEILAGEYGWAYRFGVVIAIGDPPSEVNVVYDPIVDSWEIAEGGSLFVVFGEHNVTTRGLIGKFAGGRSQRQARNSHIQSRMRLLHDRKSNLVRRPRRGWQRAWQRVRD